MALRHLATGMDDKTLKRFWGKVAVVGPDDCWNWTAGKDSSGYGSFRVGCKVVRASRFAYFLHFGIEPEVVRHTCDNPACCSPAHLIAGSHRDNVSDRVSRGRSANGSSNGRSTLTEFEVDLIRKDTTSTNQFLAKALAVDAKTIYDIRAGKTWKYNLSLK